MEKFVPPGLGWQRAIPDFRDFTPRHPLVGELMRSCGARGECDCPRPAAIDLREFFWQAENQGTLNCSSAYACLGLVEYFEGRVGTGSCPASRLFLYKTTRKLLGIRGDTGADLRTSLKALVHFGAPPLAYWPCRDDRFDDEPNDPFLYRFVDRYSVIRYVRLDAPNATGPETLDAVKGWLAAGFPSVFGVPVPSSLMHDADIPFRPTFDSILGGQAFVAVGYDDARPAATKGALLVRSSWGQAWGEKGYGWLPYPYVENQLAVDFWTVLTEKWLDSGEFSRPDCMGRHPTAVSADSPQRPMPPGDAAMR